MIIMVMTIMKMMILIIMIIVNDDTHNHDNNDNNNNTNMPAQAVGVAHDPPGHRGPEARGRAQGQRGVPNVT